MTDIDILDKAIQKAVKGGWDKPKNGYLVWLPVGSLEPLIVIDESFDVHTKYNYQAIIYSHDFAQRLWGEEDIVTARYAPPKGFKPAWKHHLQMMVVADDPIAYLWDNI